MCGVATVTAVEPGMPHSVLLFFSAGMWELYVDDLLVQTYVYGGTWPLPTKGSWTASVGVACTGSATAKLDDAIVGRMDRGSASVV